MTLSEKIMTLRRRNGWSQEELAERLDVSRQSVSKWEMGQSVPELDKIVQMSNLFGVNADTLIRDEIGLGEPAFSEGEPQPAPLNEETTDAQMGNLLSESDARTLIARAKCKNRFTAVGVALCVVAPIPLILQQIAAGIAILLVLVAAAVACFITADHLWKATPYSVYTKGDRLSADAAVFVRENVSAADRRFLIFNLIGVILFILSPIPLVTVALVNSDSLTDLQAETCVAILLGMVAVGVFFVLLRGTEMAVWKRFQAILENRIPNEIREGEEPQEAAARLEEEKRDPIGKIYWSVVTSGYLLVSFLTHRWDMTWIVWPVAGVLFGAIEAILCLTRRK